MINLIPMNITLRKAEIVQEPCDVLILPVYEKTDRPQSVVEQLNLTMNGLLARIMKEEGFKGKLNQTLTIRTDGSVQAKRILLVGCGKKADQTPETIRETSACAFHAIHVLKPKKVLYGVSTAEEVQAVTEGVRLAAYVFDRYKKQKKKQIAFFELIVLDHKLLRGMQKSLDMGELFVQGTCFARDLVNTPAMHLSPAKLVETAKTLAKYSPNVRVKIFNQQQLERMGAGGILGVAQGSEHAPYLVHMVYTPTKKAKKKIALVGKAVTFDSGGLSLKPADYMMTMKVDMAGAASVLGVFHVIEKLAPQAQVHGIFAAVENMPAGNALRPGDVVTALNKKTVEVLNTDAEGRLTLMDALGYAQKQQPDVLIDLATLTGACMVALGEEITGVMSNNKELTQQLLEASQQVGEKMWELPLEKGYKKLLKSSVADLQNIGGKYGGALTAGLFLQAFVDEKIPWAHLDIAGPAFAERDINAYTRKGATGHGVRTLLRWMLQVCA